MPPIQRCMARQRCIPDNDAFSPTSHAARRRLFLEFHMRAIRFHAFGGPEGLSVDEVPTPKAGRGEVLVPVEAAWVNPVDYDRTGTRLNSSPSCATRIPSSP